MSPWKLLGTGIWEESNYCLPVSLSPSLQLEQMGSRQAGSVCLCMHVAGAISLLDSALRAETGRVSSLEQQVWTHTSSQVCVSL